jgi:DNA transposition AAA+ family ATPase
MTMPDRTPMDQLKDQSRIRGESRMIIEGTDPAAISKEAAQRVIDAILLYIQETKITRSSIARSLGVAPSTLGQVLNWKYIGSWQDIIADLDRWLDDQKKRDQAPRTTSFVSTAVAEEIKTIADMAVALGTIGLVYGPTTSGIGKTMTLEAIRAEKAGSLLVTIEQATVGVSGLLRAIARELRCSTDGGAPILYDRIKGQLHNSGRLLMVDQIHDLCGRAEDRVFYTLCDLHDATKIPQLWCGTSDIVAYLDRGQARGKAPLAQIRRRIGIRRDLMERTRRGGGGGGGEGQPLYSIDEIRRVFAKNKMRLAPDAAQYLTWLANLDDQGALGLCVKLVRAATIANEGAGPALTAAMLRAMLRMTESERVFSLIEDKIEGFARPLARVG